MEISTSVYLSFAMQTFAESQKRERKKSWGCVVNNTLQTRKSVYLATATLSSHKKLM